MPRSNTSITIIRSSFVYIIVAILLGSASWLLCEWIKISFEKVSSGLVFLTGLYLLFYYVFVFIQKKHNERSGFIFLILMSLKIIFIFGYLFLFLNPSSNENKKEILLFLMNYFALLVVDMAIKIRLMK
jgi:hypothetical protein